MKRGPLLPWCAALGTLVVLSCTSIDERVEFHEAKVLGGQSISPRILNRGREAYMQYCYACHGPEGDGNGPASYALRPPPRDFRSGIFKFGKVVNGLPHDEDLERIIRGGLQGTAMLPWDDIPDRLVYAIIQYIKTFAPVWSDPDSELGEQIFGDVDPWGPEEAPEAIARGKAMYHGLATCQQCHAAYATRMEIFQASSEVGNQPITTFRDNLYQPEAKESDIQVGEHKLMLVPPDFLFNDVRSGSTIPELYSTIAAGVPPVMPAWHGSLEDKDIWAIAYYVNSLIALRGTSGATELQERLANQPDFVVPAPPTEEPTPDGAAPAPAAAEPAPAAAPAAEPAAPAPAPAPAPAAAAPAAAEPAPAAND